MNNKTKRILGKTLFMSPFILLYIAMVCATPWVMIPFSIMAGIMYAGYVLIKSTDE